MAVRLSPPTKMIFNISVVLGVIALILYFLNVFAVVSVSVVWAFWVAVFAWAALLAGVCMKGV